MDTPTTTNTMPKSSPRDVFMYLLATITLYFSAFSVIDLLFGYINVGFPDALNPYYDAGGAIRWSLALFIIIFPVYFWVSRFLFKDITADSGKRELRIRKWLLYLTLFLAALLIIGDLVVLIFNFLQGEITMRFFLKILSVLAVAGAIFWYYLYDLRRAAGEFSTKARWFVRSVLVVWLVVIIAGFFVAGSPFKQRSVRFDSAKVSDLQNIQGQIINYWQQKSALPKTLANLNDSISGFAVPKDSQTGADYEYRTTGTLSFELCATFNLPSAAGQINGAVPVYDPYNGRNENWMHDAGHQCFERTIDPQIYRPVPVK